MRYVYMLQSETAAGRRYVGVTSDLKQGLRDHNAVSRGAHIQVCAMDTGNLRGFLGRAKS